MPVASTVINTIYHYLSKMQIVHIIQLQTSNERQRKREGEGDREMCSQFKTNSVTLEISGIKIKDKRARCTPRAQNCNLTSFR